MASTIERLAKPEVPRDRDRFLIAGGQVVDPDGRAEGADVLIDQGRIEAVAARLPVAADVPRIDARDRYVLPGLVNAHTHAHNNLSRGSGDNWTLEQLRSRGAALYGGRTTEEQYCSAALGAVEMIKSGCTAAYDQFAALPALTDDGIDAVASAYADVGLRVVLAPSISDRPFYDVIPGFLDALPADLRRTVERVRRAPTERLLELTEYAIRRWDRGANGRITIATAPVIPGLCSDELLRGCLRLALEHGTSIHTHLAESKLQAVSAFERWGKSIVEHLEDLELLGPHLVAGHAVWVTDHDIERMAASGTLVAHNPASNLRLGSGIAPVHEMLKRGLRLGLGSDGSHASDNQDLFEAMRLAAMVGKIRFPYRTERWVGSREAWRMATTGGAAVLGMEGELGAVLPGRRADLVLVRRSSVFLTPANNVRNLLVYSETGADVTDVVIDGRTVLRDGRLVGFDEKALLARAEAGALRSREQNADKWALAERLDPFLASSCGRAAARRLAIDRYATGVTARSEQDGGQ